MRSRPSVTFDAALRRSSWSYRAANFVSYLINPLFLPALTIALVLAHLGASGPEIGMMTVLATIFFGMVPLAYVLNMVRVGETESLEVPNRRDRTKPMLVALGSYAIALGLMGWKSITATTFIMGLVGINVVNAVLVVAINHWWKISVHLIGLGSFVAILLFLSLFEGGIPGATGDASFRITLPGVVPLLVLLPLLAWARVRVGAHTVPQVVAGALFGLVLPFIQLYIFAMLVFR